MFFQKVPFCVRPFLAFFAHFRPILSYFWTSEASKHRKHTNCTYLCAKSSKKYMKMVSNSYLEFWPSQGPKNPTGPKNAPKMTGESWNWPQCTSCGLTNMFWPKKINSETVTSKPVFLVRNCPICQTKFTPKKTVLTIQKRSWQSKNCLDNPKTVWTIQKLDYLETVQTRGEQIVF